MLRLHLPPYHGTPYADPHWQVAFTVAAFTVSIAFAALVTFAVERPLLRLPDPGRERGAVPAMSSAAP